MVTILAEEPFVLRKKPRTHTEDLHLTQWPRIRMKALEEKKRWSWIF